MRILARRTLLAGAIALAPGMALASNASTLIEVDTTGAPDLAPWAADAVERSKLWWPAITARLASPGYSAPDKVRLVIKPIDGVANTQNDVITVNAAYVRAHPADVGLVAHELVHVVQAYPDSAKPGWLTEGIADFMRYYVLSPGDPKRAFDATKRDWRGGYQPSAALLDFAERRYGNVVERINAAMRAGGDGEAAFHAATGSTPEALWTAYLASRS